MERQTLLYILSGHDDFSLTRSLEELKKEIGDPATLATNTTILDGQQVTLDQLRTVCETVPFFGGRRLVIIKGLLERFEPRGRPSRQKKGARTNQQDDYKSLSAYLSKIPDSTILTLVEGRIANNNPLFRELADKAVVKLFPLLRDTELRQWIQRLVAKEGGSISTPAVDLLIKLVGSNLWIMASEINKLVLFALGRRVDEEDVKRVVSYAQQTNVFAMVDAIVEFKAELAEQLLQQLLQSGAPPAYLLVMLSRQVRMIVIARELRKQRKPQREIQSKLGLTSEFALRKTLEQANRYSLPRLKEVYHQLLETDLSIKTGKYDAELALNILIAELCRQGKTYATQPKPGLN
ncbi:DNA polymerase III subunit delta [Chloroflexota bacterium]